MIDEQSPEYQTSAAHYLAVAASNAHLAWIASGGRGSYGDLAEELYDAYRAELGEL